MKSALVAAAGALIGLAVVSTGWAGSKSARCSTTDDGFYDCRFTFTDSDGSFEISASGKPTYMLNIVEPGVAYGFVNLGSGNIALPGSYLRSIEDGACWRNDATGTEICAW